MFKWLYWHVLLRGRELPFPTSARRGADVNEAAR